MEPLWLSELLAYRRSSYSPISKGDVAAAPPSRTPVLMVIGPPLCDVLKDRIDFCRFLFAEVHQLAFLSNVRGFASYRSH